MRERQRSDGKKSKLKWKIEWQMHGNVKTNSTNLVKSNLKLTKTRWKAQNLLVWIQTALMFMLQTNKFHDKSRWNSINWHDLSAIPCTIKYGIPFMHTNTFTRNLICKNKHMKSDFNRKKKHGKKLCVIKKTKIK